MVSESNIDCNDSGIQEMGNVLLSKADKELRFTPESMYRYYKDEDFADKKKPSPTVTIEALKTLQKLEMVSF